MLHTFESIKSQLFADVIHPLEVHRKEYTKKFWKNFLLFLGLIALGITIGIMLLPSYSGYGVWLFVLTGLWFIVGLVLLIRSNYRFERSFVPQFKHQVIPFLLQSIHESITYAPKENLMNEYDQSNLFPMRIDRFRAEDKFSGVLDKTIYSFCEIFTEYKTVSTNNKGQRQEHWHTIFKGIFFASDFHKNFEHETIVDSDSMERYLGKFGRMFQKMNTQREGQLLKMESPEFEKYFAVYSTDEFETRYLLTPSMMERILALYQKINAPMKFSFRNNMLYIAISYNANLFEPTVFKTLLNEEMYAKWHQVITLMIESINDLNLNTRIWTRS
jgi:hypothetical protein